MYRYILEHYRWSPKLIPTVHHGDKGRTAYPRLAGHIQIPVSKCSTLHCILVGWNFLRSRMIVNFLQQSLICLEVTSTCMETYDAHEHILVVGQVGHRLDILDMGMLVKTCT